MGRSWSWSYGSWIYNHHHLSELEPCSCRGVLDTTLCVMWWSLSVTCDRSVVFSGTLVSSTNKTDCHNITDVRFWYHDFSQYQFYSVTRNSNTVNIFLSHLKPITLRRGAKMLTHKHGNDLDGKKKLITPGHSYISFIQPL